MKNIVENQGIKNDKPVPLSYEQLKARLDAVVAECEEASGQSREYCEGWCAANDWAIHHIHAAGFKVEGE